MNKKTSKKTVEVTEEKSVLEVEAETVGMVDAKEGAEKSEETVLAPFDLEADEGGASDNSEKKENIQKSKISLLSASRAVRQFFNISIQQMWILIVLFGGVCTIVFFVYAGMLFWRTFYFESYVTTEAPLTDDSTVTLDAEQVLEVRAFYERQEVEFERLQEEPPIVSEVR